MTDQRKIRTLVVDDEELARDRIQSLLAEQPDVEIVGVCTDGPSAVETIDKTQPDLVFLDVQMPGMDGFEVIDNIDKNHAPAVVFVTAHDAHALRAFEIHALDFLLKPFDQTRFEKALDRARGLLNRDRTGGLDPRLVSLLEELHEERKYSERLIVKSGGRVFFVRTEEIDWVEASGNYVKIHTKNEGHLLRESFEKKVGVARELPNEPLDDLWMRSCRLRAKAGGRILHGEDPPYAALVDASLF